MNAKSINGTVKDFQLLAYAVTCTAHIRKVERRGAEVNHRKELNKVYYEKGRVPSFEEVLMANYGGSREKANYVANLLLDIEDRITEHIEQTHNSDYQKVDYAVQRRH